MRSWREYGQQFADNEIRGYQLSNVVVTPGWVGRAAGEYEVPLAGGGALSGSVVFGIERVGGRAVIGMITTEQTG